MTGVWPQALVAGAGIGGAVGVALAAAAAHRPEGAGATTAALLLVMHSAAVMGLVALAALSPEHRGLLLGATILLAGAVLFAASIAVLTFAGTRLFPMSAPAGGMLMIAGWLVVAGSAVVGR